MDGNAIVIIRAASDTGITFLDTTDIYSSGE
jgi:aryl-alcohol dehydrogenase-like predicted oxidoreductase